MNHTPESSSTTSSLLPYFKACETDRNLILGIASRAAKMAERYGVEYTHADVIRDISTCHLKSWPLRLDDLLKADDVNFSHDVFGIRHHLDHQTHILIDDFRPLHSKR